MTPLKKPGIVARFLPLALQLKFAILSVYFLLLYTCNVNSKDSLHAVHVMFIIMTLNELLTFTKFFCEESFCELRVLLDYAQLTMVFPLYATSYWLLAGGGNEDGAYIIPVALGMGAFLFFVIMEYKRQDLVDVAVIGSAICVAAVAKGGNSYLPAAPAAIYVPGYFYFLRKETCNMKTPLSHKYLMVGYNVSVLLAAETAGWVPQLT